MFQTHCIVMAKKLGRTMRKISRNSPSLCYSKTVSYYQNNFTVEGLFFLHFLRCLMSYQDILFFIQRVCSLSNRVSYPLFALK